jgi:predicted ATPase
VVLTGGPGAGKTALLELVRQSLCSHVTILPEAASIVFGGGFPRIDDAECLRSAQRAIYHIQRELEVIGDHHNPAIVLCDRGTIDGVAYWPGAPEGFWSSLGTTVQRELRRYDAVIHLRTPNTENGYNHQNPLRTETAAVAAEIDARIARAWASHPKRFVVESSSDFLQKAARALEIVRQEMPECCKKHVPSVIDNRETGNAPSMAQADVEEQCPDS